MFISKSMCRSPLEGTVYEFVLTFPTEAEHHLVFKTVALKNI